MVILLEARGGVLDGVSLKPAMGCSVMHCLFREWLGGFGGGGVRFLPWGLYCRATDRAPGTNWSIVSARLVTISSSSKLDSASEECTDSTVVGSVTCTGALGSSTGTWTLRLLDTRSADSSLIGARSSTVMYLGSRSRASPTVKEGGRKLACWMSMYDSNELSTNKASPKGC